jgi:hypothetical protein
LNQWFPCQSTRHVWQRTTFLKISHDLRLSDRHWHSAVMLEVLVLLLLPEFVFNLPWFRHRLKSDWLESLHALSCVQRCTGLSGLTHSRFLLSQSHACLFCLPSWITLSIPSLKLI